MNFFFLKIVEQIQIVHFLRKVVCLAIGIHEEQPLLAGKGRQRQTVHFAPKNHFRSCNGGVAAPVHNGAALNYDTTNAH